MQLFSGIQKASETAECVIKKYKILKYVTHSFSVKFGVIKVTAIQSEKKIAAWRKLEDKSSFLFIYFFQKRYSSSVHGSKYQIPELWLLLWSINPLSQGFRELYRTKLFRELINVRPACYSFL